MCILGEIYVGECRKLQFCPICLVNMNISQVLFSFYFSIKSVGLGFKLQLFGN